METFRLEGVEIFSVGKWNGDDFTHDDLNEMIKSFEATKSGIVPGIKLGHGKEQALLKASELPSAGWVEKLYVKGDKLVADFKDIPKAIYNLIQKGAYKKPSIELFPKITIKGQQYKNLIGAVALLGAELPGVMDLSDIMALYSTEEKPKSYDANLEFNFNESRKDSTMPTKEELRAEIEAELKAEADAEKAKALEAQVLEFKAKQDEKDQEIAALKKFKADADAKALEDAKKVQEAELKAFVTELKSQKLCTPAMEPMIEQLLGEDKKEYSIKIKDEDKKLSKQELLKEALLLFSAAKEVNFAESSSKGDKNDKSEADLKDLHEKALQFSKEKGITYGQAIKQLKTKE
jgi:hypothetical protein